MFHDLAKKLRSYLEMNESRKAIVDELILALHDIEAIKLGDFKLKSGISSPIYIDLRTIVSFPKILQLVADALWNIAKDLKFDVMCGVPYTALPMATVLSIQHNKPMVMRRKEAKNYGLKKMIEGVFQAGQTCLIIEDLVTSGMSVFETVAPLKQDGLQVEDVVVLVDREQGGRENLTKENLQLHSVFTISTMLNVLKAAGRVDDQMIQRVQEFIRDNQVVKSSQEQKDGEREKPQDVKLSYTERAALCRNPMGRRLFSLMDQKRTNLCVSADVTRSADLLRLADAMGPFICVLKTHVDILEDFDPSVVKKLQDLAQKHNFLIFEDRKYADIGNTVLLQYTKGVYKTSEWADIINAHTIPGPGIISGLKEGGMAQGRGLLLLAEMSSQGNLASGDYTSKTVTMAENDKEFVMGFISQQRLSSDPAFIYMTPGVNLASEGDQLGQQYNSPKSVIVEKQCDVIIVGRGIYAAKDPAAACLQYRDEGWKAYQQRTAK